MLQIIDVSESNGIIDWQRVASANINGAVVRIGYRGWGSGTIVHDQKVWDNLQGAEKAGIPLGLYIITQAVNEAEAIEEANFCARAMREYPIQLPVCWDSEPAGGADGRGRGDLIDRLTRTKCALAFADRIRQLGGVPALYCANSWYSTHIDGRLLRNAGMLAWISSYPAYRGAPDVPPTHDWDGWQFTPYGAVDGVPTDCDISYFKLELEEQMNLNQFKALWQEMRRELQDNDASGYSAQAREWAVANGLVQGGSSTEFNGMWEDVLTREQMVTLLYRFAQLIGRA